MVEENKQEDEKKEDASGETDKKEEESITIKEARAERERLEEVYKKIKTENDRTEKFIAERMLDGKGKTAPMQKKEETEKEYAQRVMRGEI